MTGRMEGTSEKEVCVLLRDGKEVFRGTDFACYKHWKILQAEAGKDPEWCMWGSGYRIEPRKGKE